MSKVTQKLYDIWKGKEKKTQQLSEGDKQKYPVFQKVPESLGSSR